MPLREPLSLRATDHGIIPQECTNKGRALFNDLVMTYRILEFGVNPRNNGYYAFFIIGDTEFYADLANLLIIPTECMIFRSNNRQVTNWSELYCKRGIPATKESLLARIDEFSKQYSLEEYGKQ